MTGMNEDGHDNAFEPVMAIPLGSSLGMLFGVVPGIAVLDNVGLAISGGMAIGTMIGTVAYALLQSLDDS